MVAVAEAHAPRPPVAEEPQRAVERGQLVEVEERHQDPVPEPVTRPLDPAVGHHPLAERGAAALSARRAHAASWSAPASPPSRQPSVSATFTAERRPSSWKP